MDISSPIYTDSLGIREKKVKISNQQQQQQQYESENEVDVLDSIQFSETMTEGTIEGTESKQLIRTPSFIEAKSSPKKLSFGTQSSLFKSYESTRSKFTSIQVPNQDTVMETGQTEQEEDEYDHNLNRENRRREKKERGNLKMKTEKGDASDSAGRFQRSATQGLKSGYWNKELHNINNIHTDKEQDDIDNFHL